MSRPSKMARIEALERKTGVHSEELTQMQEELAQVVRRTSGLIERMDTWEGDQGRRSQVESQVDLEGLVKRVAELEAFAVQQKQREVEADAIAMQFKADAEKLQEENRDLKAQVNVLMRSLGSTSGNDKEAGRMKVPDPRPFNGVRDAKVVDNFIFDMEQYFQLVNTESEASKVTMASLYLTDDAKLWWRTKCVDVIAGRCSIKTWEDLRREIKSQFYPENVEYLARCKLWDLSQTGTVRDYVREFSSIMLDIQDMSDSDRLFKFLHGLKNWARLELRRQGMKDYTSALAAAERLDDYSDPSLKRKGSTPSAGDPRPQKLNKPNSGGERRDSSGIGEKRDYGGDRRGNYPREGYFRDGYKPRPLACYICEGPHRMAECPQKKALNAVQAMREETVEANQDEGKDPTMVGALRFINALEKQRVEQEKAPEKGLMYVDLRVGEKVVRAMIDTGATHNFVAAQQAPRLRLRVEKDVGKLKAVNSAALNTIGVARGVPCVMGPWSGKIDLTVAPLDDFDIVLGMDFLNVARAYPFLQRVL